MFFNFRFVSQSWLRDCRLVLAKGNNLKCHIRAIFNVKVNNFRSFQNFPQLVENHADHELRHILVCWFKGFL